MRKELLQALQNKFAGCGKNAGCGKKAGCGSCGPKTAGCGSAPKTAECKCDDKGCECKGGEMKKEEKCKKRCSTKQCKCAGIQYSLAEQFAAGGNAGAFVGKNHKHASVDYGALMLRMACKGLNR